MLRSFIGARDEAIFFACGLLKPRYPRFGRSVRLRPTKKGRSARSPRTGGVPSTDRHRQAKPLPTTARSLPYAGSLGLAMGSPGVDVGSLGSGVVVGGSGVGSVVGLSGGGSGSVGGSVGGLVVPQSRLSSKGVAPYCEQLASQKPSPDQPQGSSDPHVHAL